MPSLSAIVRADACGLGTLSRMFAEELGFYRTVSLTRHQGGAWPEWFGENNRQAPDGMTPELVVWLCDGADVLLSFETWYGSFVPVLARRLGVKTALVPMYECCPPTGAGLEATDLAICPSPLDLEEIEHNTPGLAQAHKVLLPIPCDVKRISFRRRERAQTFVHNAGHGGLMGRNSTAEVLEAWQHVRSPARLLVRVQPGAALDVPANAYRDGRITVAESNPANYWDLWSEGDVLLHPHKWDGLSLPIQEALAAGMPVITTDSWPFCDREGRLGWLPRSLQQLAITSRTVRRVTLCRQIEACYPHPRDIAARVDQLYGQPIDDLSLEARTCAEQHGADSFARLRELLLSHGGLLP